MVLDVDGVLTDGGIYVGRGREEWLRFAVQDGVGLLLARLAGWSVALVSARRSEAISARAEDLGITEVIQECGDKLGALRSLWERSGYSGAETAYMGDDLVDLPVLRVVGYPITVPEARPEVQAAARYVTEASGGHGAVREAIVHLLTLQSRYEEVRDRYLRMENERTGS